MNPADVEKVLALLVTVNENVTTFTAQINSLHMALNALTAHLASASQTAYRAPPAA